MSIKTIPKRGEIWLVNFDPTVGSEIKKKRPAIVISSDNVGKLPIKLVAPITDWKDHYIYNIWQIHLEPNTTNNLTKISCVDTLQLRGLDLQRFVYKIGDISVEQMEEIVLAICGVIEFP